MYSVGTGISPCGEVANHHRFHSRSCTGLKLSGIMTKDIECLYLPRKLDYLYFATSFLTRSSQAQRHPVMPSPLSVPWTCNESGAPHNERLCWYVWEMASKKTLMYINSMIDFARARMLFTNDEESSGFLYEMRLLAILYLHLLPVSAATLRPSPRVRQANNLSRCTNSTFQTPEVQGLEFLSITAAPLYNLTIDDYTTSTSFTAQDLCSVNVTYTHPGYNDTVTVFHWLPIVGWNGRFLALGGGGYAGMNIITGGINAFKGGYAVAGTDAGHVLDMYDPSSWLLVSPSNVNYNALQNFASKSMDELPKVAKQIIQAFYKEAPAYSYFQGCSGSGRQAMMSAQRYPDNYDGILANAPAINWTPFFAGILWPQMVMTAVGYYPSPCELDAFSKASVEVCDGIDGVIDGIVGNPDLCPYDPYSLVGTTVQCPDTTSSTITTEAADVAAKIWAGPVNVDGNFIWYPWDMGSQFSFTSNTSLHADGTRGPNPQALATTWFPYFVAKDPSFDVMTLNYTTYADYAQRGVREYSSFMDTNDPDLSNFRDSGGKMITWFGTLDQIIPKKGYVHYYEQAKALQPDIEDFYRLFLAPGCGHCGAHVDGSGYIPEASAFDALVEWVERGVAPERVLAKDRVSKREQPLCVYPKIARWDRANNASLASSYTCEHSY